MESMETGYNSAHTGAQIDAAVSAVSERALQWDAKQDRLRGSAGQIVGFDAQGEAQAQDAPDAGVTTFNGRSGGVTPAAGDYTAADVGAVPVTRKVNGKTLTGDIALTAADVHARDELWTPTAEDIGAVPAQRTVNGKALSANITLSAADVGARPSSWMPTAANVGARPSSWMPTASDVGALGVSATAAAASKLATARSIDGVSFNGTAAVSRYAVCSTAAATATKTVSVTGFALATGARVTVKFQYANTAYAPKLNVGGTGAKSIVYGTGSTMSGTATEDTTGAVMLWDEGAVLDFVYDGTNWIMANRGRGTGRDTLGITVVYPKGTNKVCCVGDEIFNDYRKRAYDDTGEATQGNIAAGGFAHAEGGCCSAVDTAAHAEGWCNTAAAFAAHVEGGWTSTAADAVYSHAEGYGGQANGTGSHAEGCYCVASNDYAHAEGYCTQATQAYAHSQNRGTKATGNGQTAMGAYNIASSTASNRLIVGKGTSDTARANCFRVTDTGVYAAGNYNSSGADYAEMFEWADGNPEAEDRAGRFVTLDGEKIRIAAPQDDDILGIVSGNPSVVGDVYDDQWQGMYVTDVFGRPLWEDVDFPEETAVLPDPLHPGKTVTKVIAPAHTERCQKRNPDYNGEAPYQKRTERKEWDAVGLLGKLVAVDDGTCKVNGYCTVADGGKATASAARTKYRVMARLDETHIRVMVL